MTLTIAQFWGAAWGVRVDRAGKPPWHLGPYARRADAEACAERIERELDEPEGPAAIGQMEMFR